MDGWNEIISAYKSHRNKGADRERENVTHVAFHVRRAMAISGWKAMLDKGSALPCHVHLCFVERDKRRDIGNIHGGAKYALDALTHRHPLGAGAIYDDSQRWMPQTTYSVEVDPERPGIAITVERMS